MNVTLVFSTKGQRYLRIGLAVPLIGSISCLRAMVAEEGKTTPDQVRAAHTHTHTHGQWARLVSLLNLKGPILLYPMSMGCKLIIPLTHCNI